MTRLTNKEKAYALELYKAHFTATEAQRYFPVGYGTISNLWRGFTALQVEKYNRLGMLTPETRKELIAYATRQTSDNL